MVGCVVGCVAPAGIVTCVELYPAGSVGHGVPLVQFTGMNATSPVVACRVTTRPPCGAGPVSVTGYDWATCGPRSRLRVAGIVIDPALPTATLAVAFGIVGMVVLAVMMAVPWFRLRRLRNTPLLPLGMMMCDGTVATVVSLLESWTSSPVAGAGVDRFKPISSLLFGSSTIGLGLIVNVAPMVAWVVASV